MKYTLFVFNFIFFLSGAAVLGIGIWLKVDPNINQYLEVIRVDQGDPIWNAATIILITVGAFVFVVGFLGCCGACKESSCMLCLYAGLLIVVFLGEIVAGILAAVFRNDLVRTLENSLADQAKKDVTNVYVSPDPLTAAWHAMQIDFKCCGGLSYSDFWENPNFDRSINPVPLSCCVLKDDGRDPQDPQPENQSLCFRDARLENVNASDYLHTKNCVTGFGDWFSAQAVILIGVGIGIAVLQILGIIFACCVRKEIVDGDKSY